MKTVFPVEFEIFKPNWEKTSTKLLQGFTRDISDGGLCLELKSFGKSTEDLLNTNDLNFSLTINPAFTIHTIQARARLAWIEKKDSSFPVTYIMGLEYTEIDPKARKKLVTYANRMVWAPRAFAAFAIFMILLVGNLGYRNFTAYQHNEILSRELAKNVAKKTQYEQELQATQEKKKELETILVKAATVINDLEGEIDSLSKENENNAPVQR